MPTCADFGAAFAITLVRQITRPLNRAIESLSDSTAQVTSASGLVAGASQATFKIIKTIGELIAMVGGQALAHQRDAGQYVRAAQASRKTPRQQQGRPLLRPQGAATPQRFLPLDADEDFVDFGAAA